MFFTHRIAFIALLFALTLHPLQAATSDAAPANKIAVITTDKGEIGRLLRQWDTDGTAAGNKDDWYDNRDRTHSMLDLAPYPQVRLIPYSEEDRKLQRDWALQTQVQRRVVFGNSSTASPATASGSNPRTAYCGRAGLELLAAQYRANNLYMYPEHRDHDADDGSEEGYGDLFPANTPYVLISQGSSGSDQPFMRAVPFTLAAFHPEVKRKLVAQGLLMPALQMILRSTAKNLTKPEDYLTGRAHPTVFEGSQIDALRMVKLAHEITADKIPPLVQLRLVSTDRAQAGRDYFDPAPSELLAETESAIAFVFRATQHTRRLVVSAQDSFDVNDRPLTFHWVVLRGDPAKVRITPLNAAKSRAEILITWHERAPVTAGAALLSSRVDIGVFVHNGAHYSAPAFVTSFTIPSEARTYDATGRLLEIGYGHGESRLSVKQWPAFLDALSAEPPAPAVKVFLDGLPNESLTALRSLGADYKPAVARADAAEDAKKQAEAALKSATPETKPALEETAKAVRDKAKVTVKERDEILSRKLDGLTESAKEFAARRLRELPRDLEFFEKHSAAFPALPSAAPRKRLAALGILREGTNGTFALLPLLPGDAAATRRLSLYQSGQWTRFQSELLAGAIPGLGHSYRPYVTDFRLTRPKEWRDVYAYTSDGKLRGWTRHLNEGAKEFTADGLLVLTRDAKGRCLTASPVDYPVVAPADKRPPWDWPPLRFQAQSKIITYEYRNDADDVGRPVEQ